MKWAFELATQFALQAELSNALSVCTAICWILTLSWWRSLSWSGSRHTGRHIIWSAMFSGRGERSLASYEFPKVVPKVSKTQFPRKSLTCAHLPLMRGLVQCMTPPHCHREPRVIPIRMSMARVPMLSFPILFSDANEWIQGHTTFWKPTCIGKPNG